MTHSGENEKHSFFHLHNFVMCKLRGKKKQRTKEWIYETVTVWQIFVVGTIKIQVMKLLSHWENALKSCKNYVSFFKQTTYGRRFLWGNTLHAST